MRKKKVLSKCMILCWAKFIATSGCMQCVGRWLDTPVRLNNRIRWGDAVPFLNLSLKMILQLLLLCSWKPITIEGAQLS